VGLQAFHRCCLMFIKLTNPLVMLSTVCSPFASLLNVAFCLQPLCIFYGCCLSFIVVSFTMLISTFKFNPFLLPSINYYLLVAIRNFLLQRLKPSVHAYHFYRKTHNYYTKCNKITCKL
jgi:hypothetical protein